jgi:formylglycine-generating enzyme required for sulfatase activity
MPLRPSRLLPPALLVTAGLLPLLARPPEADERRYALLVGVKSYKKDQFRPLLYAENDVNALAAVFKGAGYKRVVLMTQEAGRADVDLLPTAKNVREQLRSLLKDRTAGHTVVVAFSGHGVQFQGDDGHFFCPLDADLTDRATLISLKEVYDELRKCEARVKLLLVDACRNDPLARRPTRALEKVKLESRTRPQRLRPPGGVAALFSCSAGQESYESDRVKHGAFFYQVLQALRGRARNRRGAVDLADLFKHVKEEVPDAVKEEYGPRAEQKPELKGEVVDMVLIPPGRTAAPKGPAKGLGKEIANSIGMKLVLIPAGKFTMGSPRFETDREPVYKGSEEQHVVEITRPFYLGRYEVTQAEYQAVIDNNPSYFSTRADGKDQVKGLDTSKFPVESVSWNDAVTFCEALSARAAEKRAGLVYRLPTEAEWEYACRGGASTRPFHFATSTSSLTSAQANFIGYSPYGVSVRGRYLQRTTAVGSYQANAFRLFDMHGNVQEWCADWYAADYYKSSPRQDPKGPPTGSRRVVRGGCWYDTGLNCRAASRGYRGPVTRNFGVGFRVACSAPAGAP